MLSHSTLDDIEYSKYSYSTRKSIKNHRRRHHHSKSRKSSKNFNNYASDKCAVCLDDKIILDTKLFPCGHTFHGECLIQWVTIQKGRKFNCPLCRQDIAHFVQMTGNQKINQQLIQIWNEQYLYNTQTDIENNTQTDNKNTNKNKIKIATDEPVKSITTNNKTIETPIQNIKIKNIKKDENVIVKAPPDNIETEHSVTQTVNTNNSTDCSIWKFLWKSPLSILHKQKTNNTYSSFPMLNVLLYPMYLIDEIININNTKNNSDFIYSSKLNSDIFQYISDSKIYQNRQIDSNQYTNEIAVKIDTNNKQKIIDNDLVLFSSMNIKSGLFAGVCAATTTYLISQQLKYELHKGFMNGSLKHTFIPMVTETVPNVAIFFTTYEHLKKYAFKTNNIENSYCQTFKERFISAGIASSLSYFVSNNGMKGFQSGGLLPLRFATFFGTFELCKDIMNLKHDNIGLFGIASAATFGGGISHSLYYPLLQYRNNFIMDINNVPIGYEMYGNGLRKEIFVRNLFKGWVSSLSKFLPSCVVCSCAFEYSKRYFNDS
eukprot:12129_1